jgi:hypothetical protein
MSQQMPTTEDMMQMYAALFGSRTAKTPASGLNFLQDYSKAFGFDPFNLPIEEAPPPEQQDFLRTQTMYGLDQGSPYNDLFELINQGVPPDRAAASLISEGRFGDPDTEVDDRALDTIYDVATSHARDLYDFETATRKWTTETAAARAAAPVTLDELLNPASQYQVTSANLGRPQGYNVADLMNRYTQSRTPKRAAAQPEIARAPQQQQRQQQQQRGRGQQRAAAPAAGKSVGAVKGAPKPLPLSQGERQGFESAAKQLIEIQQQTPVWSPKAENLKRNLAALSLLAG